MNCINTNGITFLFGCWCRKWLYFCKSTNSAKFTKLIHKILSKPGIDRSSISAVRIWSTKTYRKKFFHHPKTVEKNVTSANYNLLTSLIYQYQISISISILRDIDVSTTYNIFQSHMTRSKF